MSARLLQVAGWLLAAVAVVAALQALAQRQLRAQLVGEAVAFLAPTQHGDTPYRWRLNTADALIGRRVQGDCSAAIDADGLLLRRGSRYCEVALRLQAPLDLRRFTRLQIDAAAPLPPFQLQLRERLDAPQHLAAVGAADGHIPLEGLGWQLDRDGIAAPPQRAAMLRLRWAALAEDLHLRGIALLPRDAAPWRAPPAWQPADTALPLPVNEPPLFR
ncbi:hypothetical protein, partial [Tahibacter caeni]|uniref:hypothetical protein n=1 Tax=Tahibacter caeni TaxID=1453545 RepID=UPI0021490C11